MINGEWSRILKGSRKCCSGGWTRGQCERSRDPASTLGHNVKQVGKIFHLGLGLQTFGLDYNTGSRENERVLNSNILMSLSHQTIFVLF